MLLALGVAMSIMAYVLFAGLRRLTTSRGHDQPARPDLERSCSTFSTQFVVPGLGLAGRAVPSCSCVLVVLFVVWTLYRFATAGPDAAAASAACQPAPPPGVHMPGPSFAPLLAAFGCFLLVLRARLRRRLVLSARRRRPRDHAPVLGPRGAARLRPHRRHRLPTACSRRCVHAPAPPPGVHMPGPSFRPLLVAIALTAALRRARLRRLGPVLGFDRARSSRCSAGCATPAASTTWPSHADRTGHLESVPVRRLADGTSVLFAVLFVARGRPEQPGCSSPPRTSTAAPAPGASARRPRRRRRGLRRRPARPPPAADVT